MSFDADELLTIMEVATYVKVNQQTVRNWVDRGELQSLRVGARRVRVRRTDLQAFLEQRRDADAKPSNAARIADLEEAVASLLERVEALERPAAADA